jgi:hypothetical protein
MTAPAYSLEESLERAAVTVLSAASALDDCRITSADESDEDTLPSITVRAEKLDELVLGMQTWNCRLVITLTSHADETPDEESGLRRVPDTEDDDLGAEGFKSLWKALSTLVDADQFVTDLNASDLIKVWGLEHEPIAYENENRSFARSLNLRLWCNEAFPAP